MSVSARERTIKRIEWNCEGICIEGTLQSRAQHTTSRLQGCWPLTPNNRATIEVARWKQNDNVTQRVVLGY
jgi:hypothetical protein